MSYRIDKYVWCVRLTKTRSQATELVSKGKIKLNGLEVKPSREIKVNDVLFLSRNASVFQYKVLALLEKRVGTKLLPEYLLDVTPFEEIEKFKQYQLAQSAYREYGTGKPSKKDRRDLDDFMEW